MIPEFNVDGNLPEGIHSFGEEEFFDHFATQSVSSLGRVGPSQAIDIVNEGQINGTFLGLRIAFSYLKSCS